MTHSTQRPTARVLIESLICVTAVALPRLALAQANPFQRGAEGLITNFTAIATPIAILAIMVLAVIAMTGRISWGWPIGVLVGIAVIFGATELVTWVRTTFAV